MNSGISSYSKIDLIWIVNLTVAGGILSVIVSTNIFDLSVFFSGLLCVGLIAIGRREGYLIGLYNSMSYSVLAYGNGLFGELYLNLFFFIPTGIIGYVMWKRHTTPQKNVLMRQLNWPRRWGIALVCTGAIIGMGYLLALNPKQNTPFIDATTNVLSIAATFLMMWRYKEQWLLYIALNIVTIFMWFLRVLNGSESGDLMVLMWSLYLVNALFGYWRWHKGAKKTTVVNTHQNVGVTACDAA
jgi:nicotinamide mononucleotide transporter